MDAPPLDFFAPAGRGLQHTSLRSANRRAVMTSIATHPGSSIADLARLTGLAPQTASSIVTRLEAENLVERGEVLRGRRGQPATPLFLKRDGAYSIGIEVGWRHIELIICNLRLEVIDRYRRDYPYPDARTVIDEISRTVGSFIEALPPPMRGRVAGVGLASPSTIDLGIGTLEPPPDQAGLWGNLDLDAAVAAATGLPTSWFNDGNAACWIEMVGLPAPRPADMIYLHVGTFIGAGIVAEHKLWEGRSGNSANLGAMLVCSRNQGLQTAHLIASLFTLGKRLGAAGIALPPGNPLGWPWPDLESVVAPWLADAADALAQVIANTAAVFEFDCTVIDGSMPAEYVHRLIEMTEARVGALPSGVRPPRPRLLQGRFGAEATSRGSAALVIYRRFFDRQPETASE